MTKGPIFPGHPSDWLCLRLLRRIELRRHGHDIYEPLVLQVLSGRIISQHQRPSWVLCSIERNRDASYDLRERHGRESHRPTNLIDIRDVSSIQISYLNGVDAGEYLRQIGVRAGLACAAERRLKKSTIPFGYD